MKIRLSELARAYEGQLQGDGSVEITGVASLRNAGPGDITLIEGPSYLRFLADCRAAAVIGPPNLVPPDMPAILTQDCRAVFEKIVRQFRPLPTSTTRGISPRAEIHPTARLGKDVTIHARATIGAEVTIGDNTTIHAGCVILDGCSIGADCTILPNTVLYEGTRVGNRVLIHANVTLGAYGFGYQLVDGQHKLMPQLGYVEIQDDVEIGAGTTIDRGTYDATLIGRGTKIDNQVMIGHNCRIGRHNLLCAQVGIAGSVRTGDYVVLAGQVGIKDHVDIGDGAKVGAKSGVHCDIGAGEIYFGIPASIAKEQRQALAAISKLPEMRRQLRAMQRILEQLEAPPGSRAADADAA